MVFSSIEFLLWFLPIFLILYGVTPKPMKNLTLVCGSLIFYATGEPEYLMILMISVLVNFFVGLQVAPGRRRENKHRKKILILAVAGNLFCLGFFKGGLSEAGLPLGISFYTFQILSYLIDVYRGDIKRECSLIKLSAYITMFPQLISGPIVNYREVAADLNDRRMTARGIQDGLKLFTVGLAAKVLLADRIGLLWREVQVAGFESISTPMAWLAAIAYSMKIYFDFCGYSLMAAGLGQMLGFSFPENFRLPYMAGSVREFYRRWHITLGRWFREYVYIPLGGSRKGELRTALNLLAVWVLTSLWHGSSPNFLIWGLSLWFFIVMERQFGKIRWPKGLRIFSHLYLWAVIPVTWMCFAITDIPRLQIYLGRMFGLTEGISVRVMDWQNALGSYGPLLAVCFLSCTGAVRSLYRKYKDNLLFQLLLGALFWICVWRITVEGGNPFMYFRF